MSEWLKDLPSVPSTSSWERWRHWCSGWSWLAWSSRSWHPPVSGSNRSCKVQILSWVMPLVVGSNFFHETKAGLQAKAMLHMCVKFDLGKKGHGNFWGSFSYQLIILIILMLSRKGIVILKVERQGFLMVPKSGQKLIIMMEILIALQNIFPFLLAHPVNHW